jgi:trimeric autotransporter adhesin
VIGSYSPTGLYYAGGLTAIVGLNGQTGGYLNVTLQVATIVRTNNVVTVTTAGNLPADLNGLTMNVSGVTDSSYNGSFSITTTGANALTYAEAGPNSTSAGGTVSMVTGGYALYPMAEVLSVFNTATKEVDGQMTLAANSVPWAANDAVEEPHYFEERIEADTISLAQTTPRPTLLQSDGIEYDLSAGPGVVGWTINNAVPASNYLGNGGTHSVPQAAYEATGIWQKTMDAQAGEQSVFAIHCNSHGCGRWNSGYDLFELDNNNGGYDTVSFQPTTNSLTMNLLGTQYGFSPQAFTAETVNAGTVNATTLNGTVNAANITSGVMASAQLPLFGASGNGHAAGAVPDPGVTAGTTRYLREDGSWAAPSGSGAVGTVLPTGATADYNFLQASGETLTDNSGSGNDGTLGSGALAPAWTGTGLAFTGQEQVALPAALNGTLTFFMAVYINPITGGNQPSNQYPMLVGSSLGANALNLTYLQTYGGIFLDSAEAGNAPGVFANGVKTASAIGTAGFHVFTWVLGTGGASLDHLYMDGAELPYDVQASSAGSQPSGNLFLGSSNVAPFMSSGFIGTMYRVRTYAVNTLTAAQIQQISGSMRAEVQSRGVAVEPMPIPQAQPALHFIGDSITAGYTASAPFSSLLTLTNQPAYAITNWGIVGEGINAIAASEANRVAPLCNSDADPVNALVFAGTNDLSNLTTFTVEKVFDRLVNEIQTLKKGGCRVFVGTMLSRGGTAAGTIGTMDQAKDAYDAMILARAKASGADGIVDFAANPLLGADNAYSNTAYFNVNDQTHPTDAGQALLAAAYSNVLNYAYGFNASNPNVITATTYQMLSGDGAITAAPTANAAYTAPDCVGPSGVDYVISNPQSAFTVSIVGGSGQPINGLTTPIVIPPNSLVTLHGVPNPKTISGCHWVM